MVWPYYSAKHAHNVLGHPHLPSCSHAARYPSSRMLLLSKCFLGRFEAVVAEYDLVAAVTLETEALLYAFFIVLVAVMARVFACDLL